MHNKGDLERSKEISKARIQANLLQLSTFNLLDRFDYPTLDIPANLDAELIIYRILRNIEEEISEVKKEMSRGNFGLELFEELADVVVTAENIPYIIGSDSKCGKVMLDAMQRVVEKNNAKTHETHELKNGKIQRK